MIEDYLKPLALQTDLGLGATADSFYYAAQALDDNQDTKYGFGVGGGKLPILYLYRHSIELYLKSAITLIYKISFKKSKTGNDDFPKLVENGKEKKIFNVHSIKTLFENFLIILENNRDSIDSRTGYNWFDIPEEIPILINKLEEYDSNSTMFRYPISMDKNLDYQKSTFKKCNLVKGKTPKESKSESKSKIFLLVHNGDDEIIESYVSDNEVLSEIHEVLKELSEQLSGLHFGLKFDLIR